MHLSLADFLVRWETFGYLIVFVGMILEGDAILFTAAFLTEEKIFRFTPMLAVAFAGVLIGDFLWFLLGTWVHGKFSRVARWANRITAPFAGHLSRAPLRTIFISKFVYNFHHALLFRAGGTGLPVWRFLKYDFVSTLGWMLIVGGLGYFSGSAFSLVKQYLKTAEISLLFILVVTFAILHFISTRSREKL